MVDQVSSTAVLRHAEAHSRSWLPARTEENAQLAVHRGLRGVLRLQGRLVDLARRSGQSGEADNLEYFLTRPASWKKTPWVVTEESGGRLTGAVILFEYEGALGGSKVFTTEDSTGRRNVLSPLGDRDRLAAAAANFLVRRGAHLVHIALSRSHSDVPVPLSLEGACVCTEDRRKMGEWLAGAPAGRWALTERDVRVYLPLLSTFDRTLARIGQKTRANLRYYRRRSEADLGAHFIANARPTREEFLAFNRETQFAVDEELAGWRFDSLDRLSSPFLSGVRDAEGRWLSLVGGRRQHGFAEIDWQMNRSDRPAYSLGIVMRSYLIDHDIALGSTRLYIEGGTPQPISNSFLTERVAELTVTRASLFGKLLRRVGPSVAPKKNYLAQVLSDDRLEWQRCAPVRRSRPRKD